MADDFMVNLPGDIRAETKKMAKQMHTTVRHFVYEAVKAHLEFHKARILEEENRRRTPDDLTRGRVLETIGRKITPAAKQEILQDTAQSELEKLYAEQAKLVAQALHIPTEKRLRLAEAVAAVRRRFPLTHPKEPDIIAGIEKYIVELAEKKGEQVTVPPTSLFAVPPGMPFPPPPRMPAVERVADELVGKTIDVSKLRSFKVNDSDNEPDE